MFKVQLLLLLLFASLHTTAAFAQTSVKIEISGIEQRLETNVRLFLSIEQQKTHSLMTEARIRRLHKMAPDEISRALQTYGYYRPVIKTRLTQPSEGEWLASYNIEPGPPLPIGEFNFAITSPMRDDPAVQALVENQPLKMGDVFDHTLYEDFKTSLAKLAAERGYFDASFTQHRVEIDLDRYEARVYLSYDGGLRYHIGDVQMNQEVLKPDLLSRYLTFEKGSPYSLEALIDLQHALNDSDYFQTVEVSPGDPQPDDATIPVNVTLTPRKYHRFTFGLGYGSDTGARANFGWQIPRLNADGHRFDTEARISELGYSLASHYRVPVYNPRTDQLIYSAGVVHETTDTSESTLRTIGVSLNHKRGEWRETIGVNYQQEDFIVAGQRGDSTLLIPEVSWSRTWGETPIYTLDGLRLDINVRGADSNLGSDTRFSQLQLGIKAINSINENNRFITRGSLGSTWTEDFDQLPSSVRFFAGGAQSVRGYAYHALGPVDVNGEVVGGKHLMVGSIEFEHSFSHEWGAALFYDAGNAIDDLNDKLERGAGFGFRWNSPVGPVRIDFARAISKDNKPWRLHINIGPDL